MKDNNLSNILSQYESKEQIDQQLYTLNLGPTHPATHGIFQNVLTMDGERILHAEQTVGYIHRAFEKILKEEIWPDNNFTDRMNYCSAPINNLDGI
jgi:NADH-quinone oxidoreductase subunit D